jgi:hypothetical protein
MVDFPEWSLLKYAETTLVKLILIARFNQNVDAIWNNLDRVEEKGTQTERQYRSCAFDHALFERLLWEQFD